MCYCAETAETWYAAMQGATAVGVPPVVTVRGRGGVPGQLSVCLHPVCRERGAYSQIVLVCPPRRRRRAVSMAVTAPPEERTCWPCTLKTNTLALLGAPQHEVNSRALDPPLPSRLEYPAAATHKNQLLNRSRLGKLVPTQALQLYDERRSGHLQWLSSPSPTPLTGKNRSWKEIENVSSWPKNSAPAASLNRTSTAMLAGTGSLGWSLHKKKPRSPRVSDSSKAAGYSRTEYRATMQSGTPAVLLKTASPTLERNRFARPSVSDAAVA